MTEHTTRILHPEELDTLLPVLLQAGVTVPLNITGGSMLPFLVPGRDTALLQPVRRPLRRGDMVLYRRSSGVWVLHRIYQIDADTLTMLGDAQTQPEPGIHREQVAALVSAVRRKGRLLGPGSFWWTFFSYVWLVLRPVRRTLIGLYSLLRPRRQEVQP